MLYQLVKSILIPTAKLYNRYSVVNKEKVPQRGPYIVVANHLSYVDPIYVGISLPHMLHFMAKAESFHHPILGKLLPRLGAFPVHRDKNDIKAVKKAIEILKQGEVLGIFPEGTRATEQDHAFKNGASYFSLKLGIPILPVGIIGTDHVMKKGTSTIRPSRVTVMIGNLIVPPADANVNEESLTRMSNNIKQELIKLTSSISHK